MMNQYQHIHLQTHNSNTTLPSNYHFRQTTSTTTTTSVLRTPIDTYSSNDNLIVDIHRQNRYNSLDDNYLYNPLPSYCAKHHQIFSSPTICTLDLHPPIYEAYTSSSTTTPTTNIPINNYEQFRLDHSQTSPISSPTTTTNIPVDSYEQFCIDNSQPSPTSSWITTTNEGSIYHPVQSFDQCNIYLNNSQLSEPNYRDYSSIPLSNNDTSSSSTSSSPSFNNSSQPHTQQQQTRYQHLEQSSTSSIGEKPLTFLASEARYKWMQIKRTPAKTSGNILLFLLEHMF